MLLHLYLRLVDVGVFGDEMICDNCSEKLGRVDWILLGEDVSCLFHGVCGDYDAVICFRISTNDQLMS